MTHGLASVFVNNQRVEDLDNPELTMRNIIEAYGRDPERCIVYRLSSDEDPKGERVDLEDTVDLASLQGSLHLRCESRSTEAIAPSPGGIPGEDDEELIDFEEVSGQEGMLGEQELRQTVDDEENEQESLWSPGTGAHAEGDPSGHRFYERDPAPRWDDENKESTAAPLSESRPSALGSEIRHPKRGRRRSAPTRHRARRSGKSGASGRSSKTGASKRGNGRAARTSRRKG